jgi:hypothetical protein
MHFRLIGLVVLAMPHVFAGSNSSKFSGKEPVIDFAKEGNLQRVQELIESGANINNADEHDRTELMYAPRKVILRSVTC